MKTNNTYEKKKEKPKSFVWAYDKTSECMVLEIKDVEGMFPLILKVPSAGPYRIKRSQRGGLQMTKV
ncbi:MAG: hypothetical protein Q7J15_05120 [Candidatus Desulfaltia sp.]|nr:hypothetical protein [Candidatus Desulfaltia sp.]